MSPLFRSLRFILLSTLITLAACSKKAPDGPSSATLERASLMQLAFPGWAASGPAQKQKLHVPADQSRATDAKGKQVAEVVDEVVTPEFVVRLSDDDATMIFSGLRGDLQTGSDACIPCGSDYGTAQFHRYNGNWYLTNRQDVFTSVGTIGGDGDPEMIKLAQNVFAVRMTTITGSMGETTNSAELHELTPTGAHMLVNVTQAADFEGMSGTCKEPPASKQNMPLSEEDQNDCFHVSAKWLLDTKGATPGDLILQFSGFHRTEDKDNQYRYHHIDNKQVLRYQNGKYVVVSGTNPIDKLPL